MQKLAVLFPGIGYTADKPLLHYSGRIAASLGYEVRVLPYGGFPKKVKGDRAKMEKCFHLAKAQAEEMLADLEWSACDDVLFIGKSIGTAVAAALAAESPAKERIRAVIYTPLEDTFRFPLGTGIVFTGGADPWVGGAESMIPALCAQRGIACRVIPEANHSLETSDPQLDIRNLESIMRETERFIRSIEEKNGEVQCAPQ